MHDFCALVAETQAKRDLAQTFLDLDLVQLERVLRAQMPRSGAGGSGL